MPPIKPIRIVDIETDEVTLDLVTSIDGQRVLAVAANAFASSPYTKVVHIPATVLYIDANAFANSGIEKIYIETGGRPLPEGWQTGWGAEDAKIEKKDRPADIAIGEKPGALVEFTYDGNLHTNGYTPPSHVTTEGETSGTDADDYVATYIPDVGYCWNDLSTTAADRTLRINKAPGVIYTDPTAATGLIANGTAQALVTATGTGTGDIEYSLFESGTYSTTFPTGTDADEYTVWYRAAESQNYLASDKRSFNVVIRYEWDTYPVTEAEMNALPLSWGYLA